MLLMSPHDSCELAVGWLADLEELAFTYAQIGSWTIFAHTVCHSALAW